MKEKFSKRDFLVSEQEISSILCQYWLCLEEFGGETGIIWFLSIHKTSHHSASKFSTFQKIIRQAFRKDKFLSEDWASQPGGWGGGEGCQPIISHYANLSCKIVNCIVFRYEILQEN